MYENGLGVPKNNAEAVKWYHKAAEQGDAQAQANLDRMHEKDKRIQKDYAEQGKTYPETPAKLSSTSSDASLNAFLKEAEYGDVEAQYNLGLMYSKGEGVPKDYTEAMRWLRKAAEQGHAKAQAVLTRFNLLELWDDVNGPR